MKIALKKLVKSFLNDFGYELMRKNNRCPYNAQQQLVNGLGKSDITIFDIGANEGQTAEQYRLMFPNAKIYCFEPFPDSLTVLQHKFSNDAKVYIVSKAVSNTFGRATFYINESNPTNSLLPRPASGMKYYPKKAGPKGTMDVEVITVDKMVSDTKIATVEILKLDIQGAELMALEGAKNILQTGNTKIIYTEIMFIPHYERAPLFFDLWSFLARFGYSLFDIYNVSRARNGQIRQGDAIFVSESLRRTVVDRCDDKS